MGFGGHQSLVKSCDAAARQLGDVHIILHVASEEVGFEVAVRLWRLAPRKVGAVTVVHRDGVLISNGHVRPLSLVHVHADFLAVNFDLERESDLLLSGSERGQESCGDE